MKIITFLSNEQEKIEPPQDIENLIEICTAAALEEEGIDDTAEVSVTLVDNEGIRQLNKEHRDIDRETVDFVPNYDGTTTEPTMTATRSTRITTR